MSADTGHRIAKSRPGEEEERRRGGSIRRTEEREQEWVGRNPDVVEINDHILSIQSDDRREFTVAGP